MIDFSEGADFDPGFAPYVNSFMLNVQSFMQLFQNFKTIHQKRFQYQKVKPNLLNNFENILGFYQGCLLWALYLKKTFEKEPKKILGNYALGKNPDNFDSLSEINFVISYFDIFEKDCKYYLNSNEKIPDYWKKLANTYKKFVELNNEFVNTETTADIVLPDELHYEVSEKILEEIEQAIKQKDLKILLNLEIIK